MIEATTKQYKSSYQIDKSTDNIGGKGANYISTRNFEDFKFYYIFKPLLATKRMNGNYAAKKQNSRSIVCNRTRLFIMDLTYLHVSIYP